MLQRGAGHTPQTVLLKVYYVYTVLCQRVRKYLNCPCLTSLAREQNAVTTGTCLPQPLSGEYCNCLCSLVSARQQDSAMTACPNKAAGGCHIQAHPPVLARQVENAKMAFASASISRKNLNCPLLPTPPPAPSRYSKISKWVSFIYTLGAFQTSAFALDPGVRKTAANSFKRESQFVIALWPPWMLSH